VREIIEKALARGAERCEVYSFSSLNTEVDYEAGKLKNLANTEEKGLALRLVKDGKLGYATTTLVDDVDRLIDDALETSKAGQEIEFGFAAQSKRPSIGTTDRRISELTLEEMMTRSEEAIGRVLEYEKEINADSGTERRVQSFAVSSSEGADVSFERTVYEFYVAGRLVEGDNMLECGGFYGGTAMDGGGPGLVDDVIDDFKKGRKNVDVKGGPTTVVLTPRAVADVLMTLNLGVNAAIVERKISPLTGKLGETIFDERITLYDDGLMETGASSAAFDDEGVPMQKTPLVEAGVLRNFLTDLRTAEKLDLPLTGNGLKLKRLVHRKDLGQMPKPEISNWVMKGGERPTAEIVSDLKEGVIIDSIMGIMMGNLVAGDFSGNIELGFKVENGEVVGRVKDTMVAGNVYRLLKDNLVELSSDVDRTGLMGFIGSHMYPHVVLRDVSISSKS
jgi:PmbA protein